MTVYAPFVCRARKTVDFDCRVESGEGRRRFLYARGKKKRASRSAAELLFTFDKDLTVELQRQRRDLFFIHAGVIAYRREAIAFVAPSGTGKSTTIWGLVQGGFRYMSDELLPIDLRSGRAHPYPRSLCLKAVPPSPYRLPPRTLDTSGLLYVPTSALKPVRNPLPLGKIFFLDRDTDGWATPRIRRLDTAEAGARLYANALNALAHPGFGLDGAIKIAAQVDCYELKLGELRATVDAIRTNLKSSRRGR